MTVKVLIVDDSALMRQLLTEVLSSDPDIEVVGSAPDPFVARDMIKKLHPDVLTLDVEMPRMDGLTFLENVLRLRPMPVVMVSSLTEARADVTLDALAIGAVDFVTKPKPGIVGSAERIATELCEKIKAASRARLRPQSRAPMTSRLHAPLHNYGTGDRILAIGASTGGTEAIKVVLEQMPADAPAVLIVQHIPAAFSGAFAERMNRHSAMSVCEAQDGQPVLPGRAYIAPGDHHLELVRAGARYLCRLTEAPPVNRHRPSVDVLFDSVARNAGRNAVGAILTGMGDDGARGMRALHEAGAVTFAQSEASSVVWGMPGSAVKQGGVDEVLPLDQIAAAMLGAAAGGGHRRAAVGAARP